MSRPEPRDLAAGQDRFFGPVLAATAPFVIWGVHLFFVYALVGTGCARGLDSATFGGLPALPLAIWAATLAAVAAIAWLTWRACVDWRRAGAASLRAAVRLWSGVLGLVGVLYTALPATLLEVCR